MRPPLWNGMYFEDVSDPPPMPLPKRRGWPGHMILSGTVTLADSKSSRSSPIVVKIMPPRP